MKTAGSELVYGLKDGKLIYIDEAENGLDCGCVCPSCGKPLIARQGQKNAHHFAHKGTNECEYVKQTNIHCMAEEIFLKEKSVYLPSCVLDMGNIHGIFHKEGFMNFDSVELEKKVSDFIPDIVMKIGNATLLVEIYVTHPVDEEKREKVRAAKNFYMIEIDLSDVAYENLTEEQLSDLLKEPKRTKWIHHVEASLVEQNFTSARQIYEASTPQTIIKECPLNRAGRKATINDCIQCCYFLGKSDETHINCLCASFRPKNLIPDPRLLKNPRKLRKELPLTLREMYPPRRRGPRF